MPSAQILDFGPDPFAENIGNFARGFSGTYFKEKNRKKNDEVFSRIKSRYSPDAKPEDIFKDILEAEGIDEDYKIDKLKQAREYADLVRKTKKTPYQQERLEIAQEELQLKKNKAALGPKPITPQEEKLNKYRDEALDLQRQRIAIANKNKDESLPKKISDFTNSILKDTNENLNALDKSFINQRILDNIRNQGMTVDQAFRESLDHLNTKNEIVKTSQIEKKPIAGYFSPLDPKQLLQSKEKAFLDLENLYNNGIDSQTDLRTIAKRNGWMPEEITHLLQSLYSSKGRKLRQASATETAKEITGSQQGKEQQTASIDNLLWE